MFTTDLRPLDAVPQETILTRPCALPDPQHQWRDQIVVVVQNILAHLDVCSSMRLLTSCRCYMLLSKDHSLYALLLKRTFPASYPSLATMVSTRSTAQRGLLWYRLYGKIRGRDLEPQILHGHTGAIRSLIPFVDGRIATGSNDDTVRIWSLGGFGSHRLKGAHI